MNENAMGIVFGALLVVAIAVMAAWIWCRILGKTGHNMWLGLLMLVPAANFVLMLVLAFGEWPVQRELKQLKARAPVP